MKFPGRQHFTDFISDLLRELSTFYVTLVEGDSRNVVPGFLWTLPHRTFPFADTALYPVPVFVPMFMRDIDL